LKPVVALLTDFGTRDHYVGAMRGVILGICPDATLVDITHDIPPQDVTTAALELAAAYGFFPAGTVFLCVVDPGVGSSRKALAAGAGGHRFVAPDNGLLSSVFRQTPPTRVVELTEPKYARPDVSRTFEGRDRFAPAAAWLAAGVELTALGPSLATWETLSIPEPREENGQLAGVIVRVDHFGNLVTNIDRHSFDRCVHGRSFQIVVADRPVARLVSTYSDADAGIVCALFGSTDHLEIAVSGGSAADRLGLTRGAAVVVRFGVSNAKS
jgi:S-adenosyl-L-methionine hydrolase (adenosine-forming)